MRGICWAYIVTCLREIEGWWLGRSEIICKCDGANYKGNSDGQKNRICDWGLGMKSLMEQNGNRQNRWQDWWNERIRWSQINWGFKDTNNSHSFLITHWGHFELGLFNFLGPSVPTQSLKPFILFPHNLWSLLFCSHQGCNGRPSVRPSVRYFRYFWRPLSVRPVR
jgi:hypothetical protein